ncbi:MAG: FkbM family methyltransferase [Candidatus Binatia bacterium]|nr:FkbM family methyltransferase [Candidatus Binatia bacterium]
MKERLRPLKALRALRYARQVANWPDVFRAYLRNRDVQRLVLRSGVRWQAHGNVPLMGLFNEVWRHDCYRLRQAPLAGEATVIDIGANVGVFAVLVATELRARRVYAFEPSPQAADDLAANVAANKLEDKVFIRRMAVAGSRDTRAFAVTESQVMNRIVASGEANKQAVLVPTTTLEAIFRDEGIEWCDFLKVDCEGSEYEIVLTAPDWVLRRVGRIALEWHRVKGHGPWEIAERLRRTDFKVEVDERPGAWLGYIFATGVA